MLVLRRERQLDGGALRPGGGPTRSSWRERSAVTRAVSASTHAWSTRSCSEVVRRSGRSRQVSASTPMTPSSRGAACPPMATRSFISVVAATRQPSPDLAEAVVVGDADAVQEHLVELRLAGQLAQRPDLDAGVGHVADEVRQAAVLGLVRVGAGHEDRPAGHVGHRRPDLLPVDDPLVAVPPSPGGEPGQVGARARLAEQLAPHLFPGPQRAEPAAGLLGRPEAEHRRRRHPEPDADALRVVVRCAGGGELRVDDRLQRPGQPQPAEALREVDPREPGVEPSLEEGGPVRRRRVVRRQQVGDAAADVLGPGRRRPVRLRSPGRLGSRPPASSCGVGYPAPPARRRSHPQVVTAGGEERVSDGGPRPSGRFVDDGAHPGRRRPRGALGHHLAPRVDDEGRPG